MMITMMNDDPQVYMAQCVREMEVKLDALLVMQEASASADASANASANANANGRMTT